MAFTNCYQDSNRADAYAKLEFANTYYLAYRDLPAIIAKHVKGDRALDFGCGTGRSTRFVRNLGFTVTGVDIAADMMNIAREIDRAGDYRLIPGDDFSQFAPDSFDLITSLFTFDNIGGAEKPRIFRDLVRLLNPTGTLVNVVSAPEIYTHEWASFTTRDFPENRCARSGDRVQIIVTDHHDQRPVEDILWTDESYREIYAAVGLEVLEMSKPLAAGDEPYHWISETEVAPWVIYVLRRTTT